MLFDLNINTLKGIFITYEFNHRNIAYKINDED